MEVIFAIVDQGTAVNAKQAADVMNKVDQSAMKNILGSEVGLVVLKYTYRDAK